LVYGILIGAMCLAVTLGFQKEGTNLPFWLREPVPALIMGSVIPTWAFATSLIRIRVTNRSVQLVLLDSIILKERPRAILQSVKIMSGFSTVTLVFSDGTKISSWMFLSEASRLAYDVEAIRNG